MRRLSEQDQSGDGVSASPYYSVLAKLFPKRTRCLKIQPKREKAFLRRPLPRRIEAFALDNPTCPDQAVQFAEKMRASLSIYLRALYLAKWIASSDERGTSMARSRKKLRQRLGILINAQDNCARSKASPVVNLLVNPIAS